MSTLARNGLAVATLVTEEFTDLAHGLLKERRETVLPVIEIGHPVGGIPPGDAEKRITTDVLDQVVSAFTEMKGSPETDLTATGALYETEKPDLVEIRGDELDAAEMFYTQGWTDGLPIIVPTTERVESMLQYVGVDPFSSVGTLMPRGAPATPHKVAVNAVMAGCLPEYMPILLAATEAIQDAEFNLHGVQTTTHPCGVLLIIHGPIVKELGMNFGHNCFGNGNRANATIGRAMRLILLNIGGAIPGETDKSTQGSPSKYSYCFAENEEESPWEPLRTVLGFGEDDSCVTVVGSEGPHNINDHGSRSGESILNTVAQTMAVVGTNNIYQDGDTFVILGPEHARTIADDGYSRKDVQRFLFEHARVTIDRFSEGKLEEMTTWGIIDKDGIERLNGRLPLVSVSEDIRLLVAGGAGKHSAWCPTFGSTRSVTRRINGEQ